MEIKHSGGKFYTNTEHGEAYLEYKIIDKNTMSIYHTFTPREARGHGIAEKISIEAFDFAKNNGLKVRPDCPYITYFVEKNKKFKKYLVDQ